MLLSIVTKYSFLSLKEAMVSCGITVLGKSYFSGKFANLNFSKILIRVLNTVIVWGVVFCSYLILIFLCCSNLLFFSLHRNLSLIFLGRQNNVLACFMGFSQIVEYVYNMLTDTFTLLIHYCSLFVYLFICFKN